MKRLKGNIILIIMATALLVAAAGLTIFSYRSDKYLHMAPPELPKPPLKELAENKGIELGNFASLKFLRERPYSSLLESDFSFVIADGEPNWKFESHTLRPTRDKFDFTQLDHVMAFADEIDKPVRLQHLLWGDEKWLPDWLVKGDYEREQLYDIMENHIKEVVGRYKGRIREYTVVNEAFSRSLGKGGNRDWWGDRLGEEYVDKAFLWAHETDPDAVLILNDFGNEYESDISDLMYDYVKGAKQRGIPIDGIGMQMHIDGAHAKSKKEVVTMMKRFATLDVKVYVTEFDVNMHSVQLDEAGRQQKQAGIYADMIGACLEVGAEVCPSFTFLGLVDRQTWYTGLGIKDANPLMFTDDYQPKPAYFAVRQQLE